MLREARVQSRPAVQTAKRHKEVVLPAPVSGWVSNASIAKENPGAAEVMKNFIPTSKGVRARGGSQRQSTTGLFAVEEILSYAGVNSTEFFAASNGSIYNCTSPASPTTALTAVVAGQTSNEYGQVIMAVAGNQFLLAFNGTNPHLVYDGAVWAANTPAITGVSSANINQAWIHANSVWMVEKDSLNAWRLPVDQIGGIATQFSLSGVFRRGGKLLAGATWSSDSGDGSDDRCVFWSSEGEIAVFGGDYPGGPKGWNLFGRYDMARPMGRFAYSKIGGDLVFLTETGKVALTEVTSKDPAALTTTAITRNIEPDWRALTARYPNKNWRFLKWDRGNLGIVAIPSDTTQVSGSSLWGSTFIWGVTPWGSGWTIETPIGTPSCFVVNLETGKWAEIEGWDCRSMTVFNGEFIFGTSSGAVMFGDKGGNDAGQPYECRLAYWPSRFDYIGEKQFLQIAASFEYSTSFNPRLSISTNNKITWLASPPPPPEDNTSSAWDSGLWDNAVYDLKGEKRVLNTKLVSVNKRGRVGAVTLQMTFNNSTTPDVEFTESMVTYEDAGVVVYG
jgi:hypothetical protein